MKWIAIFWAWMVGLFGNLDKKLLEPIVGYVIEPNSKIQVTSVPNNPPVGGPITNDQTLTPTKVIAPTRRPVVPTAYAKAPAVTWGVARQVGEHTWTMRVGEDARMATPKEIWEALNEYRVRQGSQRLAWDEKLASYAQGRANYLDSIKNVDGHAGFEDFLKNQNGFEQLGFTSLGENISYGYQLLAVHLIEWVYAGDKPHDDNQVNNRWNYVGIGVRGTATCLIFGTGRK